MLGSDVDARTVATLCERCGTDVGANECLTNVDGASHDNECANGEAGQSAGWISHRTVIFNCAANPSTDTFEYTS
jgi:hypothetical protein